MRQTLTKAPILQHLDLKDHIQIETNVSGYAIGRVLSQLNFDWVAPNDLNSNLAKSDFGQWHPVAYFSKKMIPAKTQYKTPNAKLSAIVEVFKTWHHYLKGCKYKVFVLTNHKNLCWFMNTKSLSFY